MSNSKFDNNGVDKSGTHWLQYAAFVVAAYAIYFGWAFFNDAGFHHFAVKIFKFWSYWFASFFKNNFGNCFFCSLVALSNSFD